MAGPCALRTGAPRYTSIVLLPTRMLTMLATFMLSRKIPGSVSGHIGGAAGTRDQRGRKVALLRDRRLQLIARQRTDQETGAPDIGEEQFVLDRRHEGAAQLGHALRWRAGRRDHRTPDHRGRGE